MFLVLAVLLLVVLVMLLVAQVRVISAQEIRKKCLLSRGSQCYEKDDARLGLFMLQITIFCLMCSV